MVEKIYLVRHGHIDTGEEKRYVGRTDILLDKLGKEQAKSLQEYFRLIPIDTVFTSSLSRCVETANIICQSKNLIPHQIREFQEIDMGTWENIPMSLIKTNNAQAYEQRGQDLEHFTPPQGESFGALSQRVMKALNEIIQANNGTIIIVAHAGVNRVILRYFLNISFQNIFTIKQPYVSVYKLERKSKKSWICDTIQ
ncbi:histidine phosphatase family protein [Sulfurospirillum arcachonense]|uniref:histidine phosphatase family protein n=1 Tax=Sulfurospirillum arcachonense TaxID=57666 RepID=UPI00046A1C4C|nr:histidine phosphatase family protein [Sulfurospirillum arcachonense]